MTVGGIMSLGIILILCAIFQVSLVYLIIQASDPYRDGEFKDSRDSRDGADENIPAWRLFS